MNLDHDTRTMEGTILRGRFAGMRLEELGPADLLALLRECRAEDEEGARLLEAYLDRVHPEWREALAGARAAFALSRERRAEDEEGARPLEAYLDRVHPEWRDELAGERAGGSTGG